MSSNTKKKDYTNGDARQDPEGVGPSLLRALLYLGLACYVAWVGTHVVALAGLIEVGVFLYVDSAFALVALVSVITFAIYSSPGCRQTYGPKHIKLYTVSHYAPYGVYLAANLATALTTLSLLIVQWLSYANRSDPGDFIGVSPCSGSAANEFCYNRESALSVSAWRNLNALVLFSMAWTSPAFVNCVTSDMDPKLTPRFEEDISSGVYEQYRQSAARNSAQPPTSGLRKKKKNKKGSETDIMYHGTQQSDD